MARCTYQTSLLASRTHHLRLPRTQSRDGLRDECGLYLERFDGVYTYIVMSKDTLRRLETY